MMVSSSRIRVLRIWSRCSALVPSSVKFCAIAAASSRCCRRWSLRRLGESIAVYESTSSTRRLAEVRGVSI